MDNYFILILFNIKIPELGNNTNPVWLDYRLDLFQRYTLPSLINQGDGIFRVWMACEEGSEDILTPKVEAARKKNPMMAIADFVFNEQAACDRFTDHTSPIYFLKLDSDDMYRRDTIRKTKEILGPMSGIPMVMFCDGYIYDIRTRMMAEFTQWSPPNIAVKYGPGTFDRVACVAQVNEVHSFDNPSLFHVQAWYHSHEFHSCTSSAIAYASVSWMKSISFSVNLLPAPETLHFACRSFRKPGITQATRGWART